MTKGSGRRLEARPLAAGAAEGDALVLDEPLSLWGGMDPESGVLIDRHHPQRGTEVSGRVLAMGSGRGSSSSSTVLAEAIRAGTAPAGVVLGEPDLIVALGSIVAAELYGVAVPVVVLKPKAYRAIRTGSRVEVTATETTAEVRIL